MVSVIMSTGGALCPFRLAWLDDSGSMALVDALNLV